MTSVLNGKSQHYLFPSCSSRTSTRQKISLKLTAKPSIPQIRLVLRKLASPRDAADVHGDVVAELVGEGLFGEDVRDGDAAARLEEAVHLLEDEGLIGFGDEVDHAVGDYTVGCGGLEGDGGDEALDEGDVLSGIALGCLEGVGAGEHVLAIWSVTVNCSDG